MRGRVWNMAVLETGDDPLHISGAKELALFSSRTIRWRPRSVHTQADPFLFVHDGWLYLFHEVQETGRLGHIAARRTRDLSAFEDLGPVLSAPHHLSYPQVFADGDDLYMLPETGSQKEVALYRFDRFPGGLTRHKLLLEGAWYDSTIVRREGRWWLFTSNDAQELHLFSAESLDSPFVTHPANPISRDPKYARNGGAFIELDGHLHRLAQDGSTTYGSNLAALRVEELSLETYRETLVRDRLFDRSKAWRAQGAHHLSHARFAGRNVVAVDGLQYDYLVNKLLALGLRWLR
ncbi:glucosamine inositolphosphorylceramide transferase family protein [Sphingomonas humi]|uniref:Glucosamine inositolphosphorylceramide transferase 1 N-terminal domain-containing protein n=1 Tax=Sphingomonas humi TaxID=335630 RepID=A0ABP7SA50_9SPHN